MSPNVNNLGDKMYRWASDLFPFCRSLTGEGVRQTLAYLKGLVPGLNLLSVRSGTSCFDWVVPDEWTIRDAYIEDSDGRRVVDFRWNNLHVLGYSRPVNDVLTLEELDKHLYSLPSEPDAIPYVTSYYEKRWGFCLTHNQRKKLKDGYYKVFIDSSIAPGVMDYGEFFLPGDEESEVLLSTYICHPSMANNELSGPVVTAALAQWLSSLPQRRLSYRILFVPETIGSIAYLSQHAAKMRMRTIAGFVVTCAGDDRAYSFMPSRLGNTLADRVAKHVLGYHASDYIEYSFLSRGSDERQYCSPGVDLPVVSIMRSKYGTYPEYHTSLDNLDIISPSGLAGTWDALRKCLWLLENNYTYQATHQCEPQLGRRSLYSTLSIKQSAFDSRLLLNVLTYSDGEHDLLALADRLDVFAGDVIPVIELLEKSGLVRKKYNN